MGIRLSLWAPVGLTGFVRGAVCRGTRTFTRFLVPPWPTASAGTSCHRDQPPHPVPCATLANCLSWDASAGRLRPQADKHASGPVHKAAHMSPNLSTG